MSRLFFRLPAVVAVSAVLVAPACGGSGSSGTSATPKGELVSAVSSLADSDELTTALQLQTTAAKLKALAAASGDKLSTDAANAIASAQIVIEGKGTGKDKAFALRGVDGGKTLLQLRVVSGTLYVQGDLAGAFALAHKENILANLQAQAKSLPAFVQAFVAGKWVSLSSDALKAIAGQVGAPTSTPSAGPKLLSDLRDVLDRDVTVRREGSDSQGDHLVLSGNTRTLLTDLRKSIETSVPGGNVFGSKLAPTDVPSRTVTLDAWVKDGALSELSLDLAQFSDKAPAGTTLPLTLTFEQSSEDITAPSGATPVDLTQLGTLIGALSGGTSS